MKDWNKHGIAGLIILAVAAVALVITGVIGSIVFLSIGYIPVGLWVTLLWFGLAMASAFLYACYAAVKVSEGK